LQTERKLSVQSQSQFHLVPVTGESVRNEHRKLVAARRVDRALRETNIGRRMTVAEGLRVSGHIVECLACEGSGRILLAGAAITRPENQAWKLCSRCRGTGETNEKEVPTQPAVPATNLGGSRQASRSYFRKEYLKKALMASAAAVALGALAGRLGYGEEHWQFWVIAAPFSCAVAFAFPADRPMGMHDVWMCAAGIFSASIVALMLSAAFPPPEIALTREFCEDAIKRGSEFESRDLWVRDAQRLCRGVFYPSPWYEGFANRLIGQP
jgi:hypothetical protein